MKLNVCICAWNIVLILFSHKIRAQISIIPISSNTTLSEISIIDNSIVIHGYKDFLVESNDACSTLQTLTPPCSSGGDISSLNRLDSNNFFAYCSSGPYNKIYKSKNGGLSWNVILDSSFLYIKSVRFFDTLEGTAICSFNKLLRTTNGGKTWTSEYQPVQFPVSSFGNNDSMLFIGTINGGIISKNRGKNWISSTTTSGISCINFYNKDTIFSVASAVNGGSYFSRTYDFGNNWNHFSFYQNGISQVISFRDPYCVYFKNKKEGYVVGLDSLSHLAIIKTTDLGNTWSVFNSSINGVGIKDFKFLNDSIAFLCGDSGKLFKWNLNQTTFVNLDKIKLPAFNASLVPNPAQYKQTLTLNTKIIAPLQIYLSDITGMRLKQMYNGVTESGTNIIYLNIAQIPSGIYFYEVKLGDETKHIRFIKE
jgi:photosystem II stability/assembly factor-like uncharacterized protein